MDSGVSMTLVPLLPSELWDLTAPFATGEAADSRPTPLPSAVRPRVLVVDDNEVNLIITAGLLRVLNCEPVCAGSGQEALELCAAMPPALVLMDINMPRMDGFECSRRLKQAQRAGTMALFDVVALTASSSSEEAARAGMDAFLGKPLLLADLKAALVQATAGRGPFEDTV